MLRSVPEGSGRRGKVVRTMKEYNGNEWRTKKGPETNETTRKRLRTDEE
jgi:hypothetical protein